MEKNEAIQSLETAVFCAMRISSQTQGRGAVHWHTMMASLAYARLALNGLSILRLSPGSSLCLTNGFQIWDLPSVSALSRNLIETYLTLHYFTRIQFSTDELQLREHVWRYHEICERVKMLRSGVPTSIGLPQLEHKMSRLKQEVELNPLFQNLPKEKRKRIQHGAVAKLETNEQLCGSAGISQNYYDSTFKYGSNHTHSSPFSFAQMDGFRAGDPSAEQVFRMALHVSTGFIALGTRDYLQLAPDQLVFLSPEEKRLVALWEDILKWETRSHFTKRPAT